MLGWVNHSGTWTPTKLQLLPLLSVSPVCRPQGTWYKEKENNKEPARLAPSSPTRWPPAPQAAALSVSHTESKVGRAPSFISGFPKGFYSIFSVFPLKPSLNPPYPHHLLFHLKAGIINNIFTYHLP